MTDSQRVSTLVFHFTKAVFHVGNFTPSKWLKTQAGCSPAARTWTWSYSFLPGCRELPPRLIAEEFIYDPAGPPAGRRTAACRAAITLQGTTTLPPHNLK